MQLQSSLIRCGLWTLPISGAIFIIGYLINGALPNPEAGPVAYMTAFGAPKFFVGAFINLIGMLLNPFGFFALYIYLTTSSYSRTALSGMILNILGLEITLAGYGVILFDLPFLGQLVIQGKAPVQAGFAVATNPIFVGILVLAGFIYLLGSIFFSIAIWKSVKFPKWVAVGFTLSAFFLCFGPLLPVPALWAGLLGALLLTGTGGRIAWQTRSFKS
jgi:hypothetical protein